MKLDILAFAAHPDDAELGCGGTIAKHIAAGYKVGIVDLTRGQLGTRGNPELRDQEAIKSADILGLDVRDNLGFEDGYFRNDEDHRLEVIKVLREYQPDIVLANAVKDRHPDHGRAAQLIADACFYAGLEKIESSIEGVEQKHWRPSALYHYNQDYYLEPDLVVDVSDYMEIKMEAIMAFSSQFYNPDSDEPVTAISTPEFLEMVKGRARDFGRPIGAEFAEGFTANRTVGVDLLTQLI